MEEKWPFIMLVVALLFGLGFVMASLERTTVMQHWEKRRCQLPVMVAARFFKPDNDPRTPSQFSGDNYEFCVKSFVDRFMEAFMAPITAIMGKQMNMTGDTMNMLNTVRTMAQNMYTAFSSYLASFFKRFNTSIYELNRIMIYLRMAVQRMSATAMSMIFSGITLFRTMINSIQTVIRVVLIICSIMLAIIIILFFVLFPFIPMIMSTLTAVVTIVLALSAVMSQSIASDAESKKSGFCFAAGTRIRMKDGSLRRVDEVRAGDELGDSCGTVTAAMEMIGQNVELYVLAEHLIYVTGSHLIRGTDGAWKAVALDERATPSTVTSERIYCFNTTSNQLPIVSETDTATTIFFRDWEELDGSDEIGQIIWNHMILLLLNTDDTPSAAWKVDIGLASEVPLMSDDSYIEGPHRLPIRVSMVSLGDWVTDATGKPTRVLGIIRGLAEGIDPLEREWCTEAYVWSTEDTCWRYAPRVGRGTATVQGRYLITESGTFVRLKDGQPVIQRDFTEIGYDRIHKTYPFVESRLR